MNPVTRNLLQNIDDPDLAEFAMAWDALEEQIVRIYRAGDCLPAEAAAFDRSLPSTTASYRRWAGALATHWQAVSIDGVPVDEDLRSHPRHQRGEGCHRNWPLMRTLLRARGVESLALERAVA
jgi:hypothetical protein